MSIKDEIEKMRCGSPLKEFPDWANTPARALINTTLAMNSGWKLIAKPRYERFKSQYPEIKTVEDLNKLIKSIPDEKDFCKKVLGLNITRPGFVRYKMLCGMVTVFDKIDIQEWAKNFDVNKGKSDPIFQVPNVGLATAQNLRICLGINTIKPDRRIENALRELGYNFKKNDGFKMLDICESLSKVTGYTLYDLDQIFWFRQDKLKNE